jgi:hypothetical protein
MSGLLIPNLYMSCDCVRWTVWQDLLDFDGVLEIRTAVQLSSILDQWLGFSYQLTVS